MFKITILLRVKIKLHGQILMICEKRILKPADAESYHTDGAQDKQ